MTVVSAPAGLIALVVGPTEQVEMEMPIVAVDTATNEFFVIDGLDVIPLRAALREDDCNITVVYGGPRYFGQGVSILAQEAH